MRRVTSAGLWVSATALVVPSLSQAQSATGEGAASAPDILQQVTVSASHIERAGFTSPTPVTSVTADDIAATGASNINDMLQNIPELRPSQTSTSNDNKQFAPGSNYADLRGLTAIRTLVLVDGERFVPEIPIFNSSLTYQVDLNVIPTIAVQRVDVVTGGASSVWGSDAIAGVVNFILYKRYDGLLINADAGISQYGDNRSRDLGVLAGTSFADNRIHFLVAGSYTHNDGVGGIFTRPWGKNAPYILPNPSACSTCYMAGTGYQNSTYAPGGIITNTALKGTAFSSSGQPYTYPAGTFSSGAAGEFGGSVPGNYPQAGVDIEPPTTRYTLYSDLGFDITDRLTADVTLKSSGNYAVDGTKPFQTSYTILSGNPFIPASTQAYMSANNIPSFALGVYNTDITGGRIQQVVDDWTNRVALRLNWNIGHSWAADGYYTYGENLNAQHFPDNLNTVRAAQAANAVVSSGKIVCANPANGCVPLDVLGAGTESPGALGYVLYNGWSNVRYVQEAGAVNLHGDPFNDWAGAVSVALGGEVRHEEQTDTNDPFQLANQMLNIDNENFSGAFSVREGYLEAVAPLAKDLPFVKEFDFNAADRETDYSTVGSVNTWKYGATWEVNDDLLLRATRSRDIRAPNLTELFYPSTLQNSTAVVPGQTTLAASYNGGNPNLKPEVALGNIVGFTYRPHFVPGLNASLDFFKLNLSDVITSESSSSILTACAAGNATACSQLTYVGGVVTKISGGFLNISTINYNGFDAEIDYTASLDKLGLPGNMVFRELGTYMGQLSYQAQPGIAFTNYAGQTVQGVAVHTNLFAPHFKGEFSAGYNLNGFAATLLANFVSEGNADNLLTLTQYPNNDVASYVRFDLMTSYLFGTKSQFQIYGTVDNLLNRTPPFAANPLLFVPTNPAMYDAIGRTYKLGFRYMIKPSNGS